MLPGKLPKMESVKALPARSKRAKRRISNLGGAGGWRPRPRHVIGHGDKWRPIEGSERSCTNGLKLTPETIVCTPQEFVVLAAKLVARALVRRKGTGPDVTRGMPSVRMVLEGLGSLRPYPSVGKVPRTRPSYRKWPAKACPSHSNKDPDIYILTPPGPHTLSSEFPVWPGGQNLMPKG